MKTRMLALAVVGCAAGVSVAQPIINGTLDGAYGAARAIQNAPTGFGDSNLGVVDFANGSELNNAYAVRDATTLYLFFGANLESNFNKFELFFDSKSGGQNRLRGDNPDVDFNGLNRMGDSGGGDGLTFDTGFEADYYLTMTGGNTPYQIFANYAELVNGGVGRYLGSGGAVTDGTLSGGNNPDGILITINNSNTAGVTGSDASGAGLVTTGIEMAIPLSALGADGFSSLRVSAMINGGGHDFLSNQVMGGVGPIGNLGEPRNVNFSTIDGDQFFEVEAVPEPATLAAMGIGLAALLRRRRR